MNNFKVLRLMEGVVSPYRNVGKTLKKPALGGKRKSNNQRNWMI